MLARDGRSPYAFLNALDGDYAEDREILVQTRGDELKTIGNMVLASKLSTLYAFSGNGKTSLVNAGLIPFLPTLATRYSGLARDRRSRLAVLRMLSRNAAFGITGLRVRLTQTLI